MVIIDGTEQNRPDSKTTKAKSTSPDQPPAYGVREGTYPVSSPDHLDPGRRPLLYPNVRPYPTPVGSPNGGGGQAPPHGPPHLPVQAYPVVYGRRPQSAVWRFINALCVAFLVWVLLGAFVRSLVWVAGGGWGGVGRVGLDGYPIPAGVELSDCVEDGGWKEPYALAVNSSLKLKGPPSSAYPYASTTSFDLPLDSESLYLLARGPYMSGSVDVVTAEEQDTSQAKVVVTLKYYSKEVRDLVKVCRISRKEGESGVGMFTPRNLQWRWPGIGLSFETMVILPELKEKSRPLRIQNFETSVSNFKQSVHDISGKVLFDNLKLTGSNGGVAAESVTAVDSLVETSNGPISGIFNSTGNVTLITSNSPIRVHVSLNNTNVAKLSKLLVQTSNGPVDAKIALVKDDGKAVRDGTSRPRYEVETLTSNNKLSVSFVASPADAVLRFRGASSNGRAQAEMNPAFQGTFKLATSNSKPALIVQDQDAPDPSGRGKKRSISVNRRGTRTVEGRVEWRDSEGRTDEDGMGSVDLHTSNAYAELVL